MKKNWFKEPSVVYGYKDTLMAFTICKIMCGLLFVGVIVLMLLLSSTQKELNLTQAKLNDTLENLSIELQDKINEYKNTITQLFHKIEQEYKENKEVFINQIIKILELPFWCLFLIMIRL